MPSGSKFDNSEILFMFPVVMVGDSIRLSMFGYVLVALCKFMIYLDVRNI